MKSTLINSIASTARRAALAVNGARITLVLLLWSVPDATRRAASALRRLPPRRAIAAAAITAAIVVPSTLYVHERGRRAELSRAYRNLATASAAEISTLRYKMGDLLTEQSELKNVLLEAGFAVHSNNELSIPVVVTGYSSTVWQTDSTPFITASNTRTRDGIVALSRDLLQRYTPEAPLGFGDIVHVTGIGDFIVEDSMHGRWKRRVDVWFPSRAAAIEFGRREVILRTRLPASGDEDPEETVYRYTLPANLAANARSAP